ncbi:MAG: esterase [Lachnospiraceae bacterium]|nr:esterase [Lachnospiraceae bacterium]
MTAFEYGDPASGSILIEPVDERDLPLIAKRAEMIRELSGTEIRFVAVGVKDWNNDLSPWKAEAVFGNEGFGGGAKETLSAILELATRVSSDKGSGNDPSGNKKKKIYMGGYSLAGLFSLWAAYQTDVFSGIAAVSPSLWYPGFMDHMRENRIRTERVDLSLGDREEKVRNLLISQVGNNIREAYNIIKRDGAECCLTWNEGNHFKDADKRTVSAFLRLIHDND